MDLIPECDVRRGDFFLELRKETGTLSIVSAMMLTRSSSSVPPRTPLPVGQHVGTVEVARGHMLDVEVVVQHHECPAIEAIHGVQWNSLLRLTRAFSDCL